MMWIHNLYWEGNHSSKNSLVSVVFWAVDLDFKNQSYCPRVEILSSISVESRVWFMVRGISIGGIKYMQELE